MNCGLATFSMMTLRAKIDETYAALQYEQSLYFPQTEKIVSLEMDLKCLQTLHATSETALSRELIAYGAIGLFAIAFMMFSALLVLFECIELYNAAWMMTKCKELSATATRFFLLTYSLYCVVFCPPVFVVHVCFWFNTLTVCYILGNVSSKWGDEAYRICQRIVGFVTQNYQNIMLSVIAVMMCVIALK